MNQPSERIRGRAWQEIRKKIMMRDGHLCVPCRNNGEMVPAHEVDHIKPIEDDGDDSFGNLQAICDSCHKQKTNTESSGAAVSELPHYLKWRDDRELITIVGRPYAGKNDRAMGMARPGDQIVNADNLALLTVGRRFFSGLSFDERRSVLRRRNRALKEFLDGNGYERCINVVTGGSFKERQFWGAISHEMIIIEGDPDQCKMNAERELVFGDLDRIKQEIDTWR